MIETKITRGKDGRKKFTWVVKLGVSKTWVEDGFELTDERALEMLDKVLPWAIIGMELSARVIARPNRDLIAKAQGYKSAKHMDKE